MSEIASRGQLRLAFLRWAIVTVPLVLLLGFFSAQIAPAGSQNPWYRALAKPALTPPDWVFPVAWSTIYILMGLALAIVINARGSRWRGAAIALFVVQLIVNLAWSPIFFGMHAIMLALMVLGLMWILVLFTIFAFGRVRSLAAWLMVPYIVWVSFAGALLFGLAQLNPDAQALVPAAPAAQMDLTR